jgi:hypothetical protein
MDTIPVTELHMQFPARRCFERSEKVSAQKRTVTIELALNKLVVVVLTR